MQNTNYLSILMIIFINYLLIHSDLLYTPTFYCYQIKRSSFLGILFPFNYNLCALKSNLFII